MKRMAFSAATVLLALLLLTPITLAASLSYTYQEFDVGGPTSSSTFGYGINNSGEVSGTYEDESCAQGFLSNTDGKFTTFGCSSQVSVSSTYGYAVNDTGEVTGFYIGSLKADAMHGFVSSADGKTFTTFDDPSGVGLTYAYGINNSGQVSGYYFDSTLGVDGICYGFLRSADGKTFTPVNYTSATFTQPSGISNNGQVTGIYRGDDHLMHGFVRSAGGTFTKFDHPSGVFGTYGQGINNSGQVAGYYLDDSNMNHGFVRSADGTQFTPIDYPTAAFSGTIIGTRAQGINDNGQVVGYFMDSSGKAHGFIATPTGATYSISGTVECDGSPLQGVSVALSGKSSAAAQTDSKGTYSFSGLKTGSYTVTPSISGYSFNPQTATVPITNQNMTENFTATAVYSISGKVTAGSSPLAGVTITLSGASKGSTKTGPEGSYSFAGLPKGSYTITPSMTGYTFSPPNSAITLNRNVTGQDFTATVGYSIGISIGAPSARTASAGPVTYPITYTHATTVTLDVKNVTLNKTGTATGAVTVTGSGAVSRSVTINNIKGNGTLGISIAANTAQNDAGHQAPAAGPSGGFTVYNPPKILAVSPNGGEALVAGKTYPITWQYGGDPGPTLQIELLDGSKSTVLTSSASPLANSWKWAIPIGIATGTNYKIRITSNKVASCTRTSAAAFTIVKASGLLSSAGSDQTVQGSSLVTLSGANTIEAPKGGVSYEWTQLDGPKVTLSTPSGRVTTFEAPAEGTGGKSLRFQLTASREDGGLSQDTRIVNVSAGSEVPSADAGLDQTVFPSEIVQLDGSKSSGKGADISSYQWKQIAGTPVELIAADSA